MASLFSFGGSTGIYYRITYFQIPKQQNKTHFTKGDFTGKNTGEQKAVTVRDWNDWNIQNFGL